MKSEKDSLFYFKYFNEKSWLSDPLKSIVISILLKIGIVKFLKNLHIGLIAKKQIFQIKIINKVIIYILIQYKVLIYSP